MSEKLPDDTVVIAPDSHLSEVVEEELIVLNVDSGTYYSLTGIGEDVWEALQEPIHVGELKASICREYDVDAVRCSDDVEAFLVELIEENLIEIRDEPVA